MNLSFQVLGAKAVASKILSIERRSLNSVIKGAKDAGSFVHRRAISWAPVDTGTLQKSLKEKTVKKMFGATSSVTADATEAQRLGKGSSKSYALAAHELPKYRKPGARPRFLAKALDESHMEIMDAFNQEVARIPGIGSLL